MDSVTQFMLGAAVGGGVGGRRLGRRGVVWGGVCGTLPDLDVFYPYADVVSEFTLHRSVTHSFLTLTLLTPVIVALVLRLHRDTVKYRKRWYLLVFLALVTHPVLDCFTVYGTQVLWPFSDYPVAWSTVFIIDPAYTLPLLIGVVFALVTQTNPRLTHRVISTGLAISVLYLGWTVVAKIRVQDAAERTLARQKYHYDRILTTPTPFNSLSWRIVAVSGGNYLNGYYSILDPDDNGINWVSHPRGAQYVAELADNWATRRLVWFSRGYYKVEDRAGDIVFSDLRMGFEPNFVFTYKLAERNHGKITATLPRRLPVVRNLSDIRWSLDRIRSPHLVHE